MTLIKRQFFLQNIVMTFYNMLNLGFKTHNCPKINISNSHRKKNIGWKISFYLFIAISFYFNIVRKNSVCELGLRAPWDTKDFKTLVFIIREKVQRKSSRIAHNMMVKLTSSKKFHQHSTSSFFKLKVFLQSFSLLTVKLCNVLVKEYRCKSCL